jgi:SM-20-related protein
MSALPTLRVNPELDLGALAAAYQAQGRVRIGRVLSEGAPELYYRLEAEPEWVQLVSHETGAHEIPWHDWARPGSPERREIEPGMVARARDGFQYSYAAMRIPPAGEACDNELLSALAEMMRSPAMLGMLEAVTGVRSPTFIDGQVTAYAADDFLTGHDDDLIGEHRKTAFVLGLTPQWRLEWGGLLLFHEIGSTECAGLVPQFNTLDLFTVPTYHSVSQVTRAAPRRRYSITGWLSGTQVSHE